MENLILASSSPRRKALLQQVGLTFKTFSPNIDEAVLADETATAYVERLAKSKALAVLAHYPDAVVLAADTTLHLDQQIITQAENKQQAFAIWTALSGRTHQVLTGVCVARQGQLLSQVVSTEVEFQTLTHEQMQSYWDTGEPMGKAGAYAIQGIAAQFIPRIVGSYSNVVGLPLHETMSLLEKIKAIS